MSFSPFSIQKWLRGATLVSEPDLIPDDALRIAFNVRLDRTIGVIEARPGWVARTVASLGSTFTYLSRLFTPSAIYGYVQVGSNLLRVNGNWVAPTSIATPGTQVVSDANSPDGNGHVLKYFVNDAIALKDSGTVVSTIGIAPPTAAPLTVSLAPDLFTNIALQGIDTAANWTGTNLTAGPGDDFTFFQVPNSSVNFSIGASTTGSIAQFIAAGINLDTLPGGDALVKDDDYIYLLVRIDHPERLLFFQLDIDCDVNTTGVVDAFQQNYYSISLGTLTIFSQGANQWNILQIRKSRFSRYGADTSRSWAHARAFKITFITNTQGAVTVWVNDFKLRGGIGLEGDIEYTACYRNSTTMARGNPPKSADGVVLYTPKLTTNRQRIDVTTTQLRHGLINIGGTTVANANATINGVGTSFLSVLTVSDKISLSSAPTVYASIVSITSDILLLLNAPLGNGTTQTINRLGAFHPDDVQIDKLMLWRRGASFTEAVLVETIPDTDGTHYPLYHDITSDETLVLDPHVLELDNDMPPSGSSRVLFGPGATGHFFMIVDGQRLYISKSYETLENRVENWPTLNFALIGDGSTLAVAGLASATQVRVWTTERSYNIIGVGGSDDTFLPVALDGSRGCVGQFAVCEGDDTLFFIAQDGIFADKGGRQIKLTAAIDPFFQGITVDGQVGWNTSPSQMALARLAFLHEPTGSTILMLYAETGSPVLNAFLVLKPAGGAATLTQPFSVSQTVLATECFFGTSALTSLQALYLDNVNRELLAGGANGHVYRIEDPSMYSDAGTAIFWRARTKSMNQGGAYVRKQYSSVLVEGNTSGQISALLCKYDRAASFETLSSSWSSNDENSQVSFRTADETALHYNIALDISGNATARVAIIGFVVHAFPHPELQLLHDTNEFIFQTIHELRKVQLDLNAPSAITLNAYLNGVVQNTQMVAATVGRQRVDIEYPLGLRSKLFRLRWTTPVGYEMWEASAWLRPEPEDALLWDSDEVYFELMQQLKLFTFDIDAPANITVAVFIDGVLRDTRPLFATSGRAGVRHYLPAGLSGKEFRMNLTSLGRFQVWDLNGWYKPLGGAVGYQPTPMTRRQLQQVIQKLL